MINVFQAHFVFIILSTLTVQIDSNTHFSFSIVGTFSAQMQSNLIPLPLFLILSLVKPFKSRFIFIVVGALTDQID